MSFKYGVFDWGYSGGSFPCAFRPSGLFYCGQFQVNFLYRFINSYLISIEKFPAQATWSVDAGSSLLIVDWKKYGKYAFDIPVEDSNGTNVWKQQLRTAFLRIYELYIYNNM